MPSKPAHLAMIGGKSPRQRIWEAIRTHAAGEFTQAQLSEVTRIDFAPVSAYVVALVKAGYLELVREEKITSAVKAKFYRLAKDCGIEAPRLTKDGKPATKGVITENIWRAMRMAGAKDFNSLEIAALASNAKLAVSDETVKSYITALLQSGYLVETKPARHGRTAIRARYRLMPINAKTKKAPGPRPPIVQQTKSVYDPNIGAVVWREEINQEALNDY